MILQVTPLGLTLPINPDLQVGVESPGASISIYAPPLLNEAYPFIHISFYYPHQLCFDRLVAALTVSIVLIQIAVGVGEGVLFHGWK